MLFLCQSDFTFAAIKCLSSTKQAPSALPSANFAASSRLDLPECHDLSVLQSMFKCSFCAYAALQCVMRVSCNQLALECLLPAFRRLLWHLCCCAVHAVVYVLHTGVLLCRCCTWTDLQPNLAAIMVLALNDVPLMLSQLSVCHKHVPVQGYWHGCGVSAIHSCML